MNSSIDPKEKTEKPVEDEQRVKQQQSDPNITELKGLTDSKEELEPKDTDNDID